MSDANFENAALPDRPGFWRVSVRSGLIHAVERATPPASSRPPASPSDATSIDCAGRLLAPGFTDCHTHACWAGDRLDEWQRTLAGVPYLQILAEGGGIMSTVRAVRAASESQLADLLLPRLLRLLANGSTTIEIKSGYGLTTADELKMLRAIRRAAASFPGTIVPTALLGHAIDPDLPRDRFIRSIIDDALPAVSAEFPGIAIDAYCEKGAWTPDECAELFQAAIARGHPVRVHADQFNSLGMTPRAVALGARSVDHLEASTPDDLAAVAASPGTFAVALPACALHLAGPSANLAPLAARAPDRICLATNLNPGSAPCWSLALVAALAVRRCGLSPDRALSAITTNPARLLGLHDRGVIEPGRRADLVLLHARSPAELAWGLGDSATVGVWVAGRGA